MNKKSLYLIFTSLTLTLANIAVAADVQIILEGKILGQSCNINAYDLNKTITFPDIISSDFKFVGDSTNTEKFNISLSKCTGNVTNLSYKFSGELDDINPKLFKIKGSANVPGIASGVGIEVLNNNLVSISPDEKTRLNKTITSSNYNLEFNLRYKSTSENIVEGDASSILYLDIYYD